MTYNIFDSEFLKRLERLSLNMQKLGAAGSGGLRKSKAKGSSVEFSDFREYAYGDDLRRVDWNAYGRSGKLYVKLFMEEREAMVNIFLDCSRSMDFGGPKKSLMSIRIALAVSFLALNNMDRLSINLMQHGRLKSSSAFGGRGQFESCTAFIDGIEFSGETHMDKAIKMKRFPGRGLSVVISDFFNQGSLEDFLRYLTYHKQDIVLLHILSPEELDPKLSGQIRLKDSETDDNLDIDLTPQVLDRYYKTLGSFRSGIREAAQKYGGAYVGLSSGDSLDKILFEDMIMTQIVK